MPTTIRSLSLLLLVAVAPGGPARAASCDGAQTNSLSSFEIAVDGRFTGGVTDGMIAPGTEWSDVTPRAFRSGTPPEVLCLGDPAADVHVYAAIAPGISFESTELYLMYDYLGRTDPTFVPGELIADIVFPVTSPLVPNGRGDIVVQIRGADASPQPVGIIPLVVDSFFDVFVDVDLDGIGDFPASQLGIEAGVGFGPSPLGSFDHLLVELEVPLLIPAGFGSTGGPFPPGGLDGIYSPDPAFWGAFAANDAEDPPISAAIFQINPDGSVTLSPVSRQVPEPSSLALFAAGMLAVLGVIRRSKVWRSRRRDAN